MRSTTISTCGWLRLWDSQAFAKTLDAEMRRQNIYYDDLVAGGILRELVLTQVAPGGFRRYMEGQGKLGGQNKVPRLSNDRRIADALLPAAQKE